MEHGHFRMLKPLSELCDDLRKFRREMEEKSTLWMLSKKMHGGAYVLVSGRAGLGEAIIII